MNTQTEAERLADLMDENWEYHSDLDTQAAAELRRLKSVNKELRDALAKLAEQPAQQTGCTWARPDSDHMPDTWQADCGATWTFTEGGPKDNDLHFCPKCGKPAIEADKIKENT